ncbi:hypothetical protein, partial [Hominenteromicrobium sp.]|uniref:hypothetical protein n=1 Tax=Hominenteromicrobium sp. TaxID=3073581 RepID=UPI003AF1CA72
FIRQQDFSLPSIKTTFFDFRQKESTQKNWSACFYASLFGILKASLWTPFGRPPNWVSHEGTVHWTVPSPVLILWQAKGFRALRSSTKGFTLGFHSLLKKAGENFYVASLCLTLA